MNSTVDQLRLCQAQLERARVRLNDAHWDTLTALASKPNCGKALLAVRRHLLRKAHKACVAALAADIAAHCKCAVVK